MGKTRGKLSRAVERELYRSNSALDWMGSMLQDASRVVWLDEDPILELSYQVIRPLMEKNITGKLSA